MGPGSTAHRRALDVGTAAALFLAALDARTNIGYAVEPAAPPSASEPEAYADYVSAYDLGRFAGSARFMRTYRAEPGAARSTDVNHHADPDHGDPPR
jgi:hypothetical protein